MPGNQCARRRLSLASVLLLPLPFRAPSRSCSRATYVPSKLCIRCRLSASRPVGHCWMQRWRMCRLSRAPTVRVLSGQQGRRADKALGTCIRMPPCRARPTMTSGSASMCTCAPSSHSAALPGRHTATLPHMLRGCRACLCGHRQHKDSQRKHVAFPMLCAACPCSVRSRGMHPGRVSHAHRRPHQGRAAVRAARADARSGRADSGERAANAAA